MALFVCFVGLMGRCIRNVVLLGVVTFLLVATSIGRMGGGDIDGRLVAADAAVEERQVQYPKYTRSASLDCEPGKGTTVKKPSRCKIHLPMGESAKINFSVLSSFWPELKGNKNWTNDVACVHEPQLNSKGDGYDDCKQTMLWKDLGVKVTSSGVWGKSATFALDKPEKPSEEKKEKDKKGKKKKESKDPELKFTKVTTLYGVVMSALDMGALVWEMTLYPEPAPSFALGSYQFDDQMVNPGRYKYVVDMYRGDMLTVKCYNKSLIDPINALETGGDFCPDPMTPTALCKNQRPWTAEEFVAEKVAAKKMTTISSTRKYRKGGVVNAYFQCVTHSRDILVELKLHPIISPRFIHIYQMPGLYQQPCNPGDAPSPDNPCGGDIAASKASYVNCTGLFTFDPPDINTPEGSFCTEPYADAAALCTSTKKWSDVFTNPMVQSEERLFSVFNGGAEQLPENTTIYGRCVNKQGTALFFKYTFISEAVKAPAAAPKPTPAPTSGASTTMVMSALSSSFAAMGLLHFLVTGLFQ